MIVDTGAGGEVGFTPASQVATTFIAKAFELGSFSLVFRCVYLKYAYSKKQFYNYM